MPITKRVNKFKTMSTILNQITIIQGESGSGKLSNALYLTKKYMHKTAFVDFKEYGVEGGIIPACQYSSNLKSIIFSNVEFPEHSDAVQLIVNLDKIPFANLNDKNIPAKKLLDDYEKIKIEARKFNEELNSLKDFFKIESDALAPVKLNTAKARHDELLGLVKENYTRLTNAKNVTADSAITFLITKPALIFLTCSPIETIPFHILPGKVGLLKCG